MKKIRTFVLTLALLFLNGCGTPKNSELAFMGLWGAYVIFLISTITLFFFEFFKNRKQRNFRKHISYFKRDYKLLFWILLILSIIGLFFINIISFIDALSSDNPKEGTKRAFENFSDSLNFEDNFFGFWFISFIILILCSISTIIYSLVLLFLFTKIKKYNYLIPVIVTAFYVVTLLYVYRYDHSTNEFSLLVTWVWPVIFISKIVRNLYILLSITK